MPTTDNIKFSVASIRRRKSAWGEISHYLQVVEQTNLWSENANSFSEWMRAHSQFFEVKESTLWRYLTAGRYYNQLRERLSGVQYSYPPLEQLSSKISPENIEILSKIERVAPPNVFTPLAHNVIDGTVKRSELRRLWLNFRPVLLGKTARGRDVTPPKFNPIDLMQRNTLMESMFFNALEVSDGEWLGIEQLNIYKVFTHVKPLYKIQPKITIEMDAVILSQDKVSGQIMLHVVEVSSSNSFLTPLKLKKLEEQSKYCHRLWITVDQVNFLDQLHQIPSYIGLLTIEHNHLHVVKAATESTHIATHTEELANALLLKAINY